MPAGFEALARVGGIDAVQRHATCLAAELRRRLLEVAHANGAPLAVAYGEKETTSTVVTFNVLDDAGRCVSPAQVAKVASAAGIQLRHGCFCNPGACAKALGLRPEDVRAAADRGRACGGDDDLDDAGRPLGALRASLGKDSIFEDVDALAAFLRTFALEAEAEAEAAREAPARDVEARVVADVFVYPIKSCRGVRVADWPIGGDGRLAWDRAFALVDDRGQPLTAKTCPRLAVLTPRVDLSRKRLSCARSDTGATLDMDLDALARGVRDDVDVCGVGKGACDVMADDVDAWFSDALRVPCGLARRKAGGFANEAPLLLVTREALDVLAADLAGRDASPADAAHFRPNVVVARSTSSPPTTKRLHHPEDAWTRVEIGGKRFEVAGPCARCATVEIDPSTGFRQGRKRVIQRRFNVGVLEAISERKASTL